MAFAFKTESATYLVADGRITRYSDTPVIGYAGDLTAAPFIPQNGLPKVGTVYRFRLKGEGRSIRTSPVTDVNMMEPQNDYPDHEDGELLTVEASLT
jgi:hypothetical protein